MTDFSKHMRGVNVVALYGGKLADKGHGVEPLTHIRPIYCVQAVCLCLLAFASLLAVGATTLLRPYVER